jgi:hypothetical protein
MNVGNFGGSRIPYYQNSVEIEANGWQLAELMHQEIAQTDFCYLPYWFELHNRRHVKTLSQINLKLILLLVGPFFIMVPIMLGLQKPSKCTVLVYASIAWIPRKSPQYWGK